MTKYIKGYKCDECGYVFREPQWFTSAKCCTHENDNNCWIGCPHCGSIFYTDEEIEDDEK